MDPPQQPEADVPVIAEVPACPEPASEEKAEVQHQQAPAEAVPSTPASGRVSPPPHSVRTCLKIGAGAKDRSRGDVMKRNFGLTQGRASSRAEGLRRQSVV